MIPSSVLDKKIIDPGFDANTTVAIGYDGEIIDGEERIYAVLNMRELTRLSQRPDQIRDMALELTEGGDFTGHFVASNEGNIGIYFDAGLMPVVADRFLEAGLKVGISNDDIMAMANEGLMIHAPEVSRSALNFEAKIAPDLAMSIVEELQSEVFGESEYAHRDGPGL